MGFPTRRARPPFFTASDLPPRTATLAATLDGLTLAASATVTTPVVVAALANTFYTQALAQEAPIAYWRLGEVSGAAQVFDEVALAPGTLYGGGTRVDTGAAGWSGDGNTALRCTPGGVVSYPNYSEPAYVDCGTSGAFDLSGPFSVMVAFKVAPTVTFPFGALVSKYSSAADGWTVGIYGSGQVRWWCYRNPGVAIFDLTTFGTYNDNQWHLMICTVDPVLAKTAAIYVDGVLALSVALTPGEATRIPSTARLLIGACDIGGGYLAYYNASGLIDEVAIYGYALRAGQVALLYAARNRTANGKSPTQARAGQMRTGNVRAGYFAGRVIVLLNGVDVTGRIWKSTLSISELPNEQADAGSMTLFDRSGTFTPVAGQTVIIADGQVSNRVFGGTILRVTRRSVKNPNGTAVAVTLFDLSLTDWTWLLNRRTITGFYPAGTSTHDVFIDIVARATTGFTTNAVRSGPVLTAPLSFKATKVAAAFSNLCQATSPNWAWYVDANLDLHYFLTESAQRPRAIAPGNLTYDQLDYALDISQIRTRILVEGGGGQTTAPVAVAATTIAVDECAWYSAAGGTVVTPDAGLLTYAGVSAASGPGSLTGVAGVTVAILQGAALAVWVVVNDLAAQAALGLLERNALNAATDGIHEQPLSLPESTIAQCTQAGVAELAAYAATNITGSLWSRDRQMKTGKMLSLRLPVRGIVAEVRIQQVTRTLLAVNVWQFDVTFATVWRNLVDVLNRLQEAA